MDGKPAGDYPRAMDLATFLVPVAQDEFLRDRFGKTPLHIPAAESRPPLVTWQRMNELLAVRSHWSEANLKLILNSRAILPEFYIDEVETPAGPVRRADPAKVDVFLGMGASLVAHAVQEVCPEIEAICGGLGDSFAARAEANIYCSFEGVQAFASHFDLHEVFVLQCEGEKLWNVYENRAASPVEALEGDNAQDIIDAAKGRIALQVRMRPGDRLYIPRGFYHDAIAVAGASLHVTFSVAPLTGLALFAWLAEAAAQDEAFRAYLPDARAEGGATLEARLGELGARLEAIVASSRAVDRIANRQRQIARRPHRLSLPDRPKLHFYARTALPASVDRDEGGTTVQVRATRIRVKAAADALLWILQRGGFSREELGARFDGVAPAELDHLIAELEKSGAIAAYQPSVA